MTVTLPDGLRAQLRALVASVVSVAQDVYRRRMTLVAGDDAERPPATAAARPSTVGDQWPKISQVLHEQLGEHPDLLDRVLVALANIKPVDAATAAVVSSRG